MKPIVVLLTFAFLGNPSVFFGQQPPIEVTAKAAPQKLNWRQHRELGEKSIQIGKIIEAAQHFETAFYLKPKNLELAYKSAGYFAKARDYRKAAEMFHPTIDAKEFPKARLDYALALQQSGAFDEALPEFMVYLNNYTGKERETVAERIEERINGCALAIRQSDSTTQMQVKIEHLDNTINTENNEIAPVPFGDDILYFTKLSTAKAEILRSQFVGGKEWSSAEPLKVLNIPANMPFGNGTFSPDGSHFFCTMCQTTESRAAKKLSCGIYVLNRLTEGWSIPKRLSERVNTEGGITTQPFVFQKGNKEFLFFVSDRPSGKGGMDIWSTSRLRGDDQADFEQAVNLGWVVNTDGDEVTPFYDVAEGSLYFASNGRATVGGLDIFKSQGWQTKWTSPENMGLPFNSGADDWYFVKNPSRTGGFLVSNRSFGMEKIGTRDDDLFQFTFDDHRLLSLIGRIFDKKDKILIENTRISLYEKRDNTDDLKLLSSVVSEKGNFNLSILPQKNYTIEIEKDGYRLATSVFSTRDSAKNQTQDFYLEKYTMPVFANNETKIEPKTEVKTEPIKPEKPLKTQNTEGGKKEKLENPKAEKTTEKRTESNEKVEFKVQIMAYASEKPDHANLMRLKRVDDLGDIETESAIVNGTRYTRFLMSFDSYVAAQKAQKAMKDRSLNDAFIIRYENGKRTNKGK